MDDDESAAVEDRRREAAERFLPFAMYASDIVVQFDLAGRILFASPSISRLGFEPHEVEGLWGDDIYHPDDMAAVRQAFMGLMAGGVSPPGGWPPVRLRRKDGDWSWFAGNPSVVSGPDGKPQGVVTILRDVNEQVRLREESQATLARLQESERRFRALAEQSGDVIIRYDLSGKVEFISDSIRRYGGDPARIVGCNMNQLISPDDWGRSAELLAAIARGEVAHQGPQNTWRVPLRNGSFVDWEGLTTPLYEDGRVVGAMLVMRDATERVALETKLKRQQAETEALLAQVRDREAQFRLVTDNVPDIIARGDPDGTLRFVSPSIASLGYTPADLEGRPWYEFVHPDDVQFDTAEAMRRGETPRRGADHELRVRRADGGWAWMQCSPAPIRDEAGAWIGWVMVIHDVTERREMGEALRRTARDAQAAAIAKSEFLANMSHELRTPLTAVVGFAGLMGKMPDLPDRARIYADRIARSGEALAGVINNVLDFSRIEAGQLTLKAEPFDLEALVRECAETLEQDALDKRLSLDVDVEAPGGRLIGDATRLRQILLNLLANAIKFTFEGGVVIVARHDAERGRLRFEVTDTGVGVPPDIGGRIFERFTQGDGGDDRRFGGAGLGLSICKSLVDLMGGTIGHEPRDPHGTRFWFEISAYEEGRSALDVVDEADVGVAPLRVLVVDDVQTNRELISALLSPFDASVREACGGAAAVAAAREEPFDVILMDIQMPEVDGFQATRAIRAQAAANRSTPILAVSASVQPSDVEACRQAGMNDHVAKPINPRDLIEKLARWAAPSAPAPVP